MLNPRYQIAMDMLHLRRRADETGLDLRLTVFSRGFTVAAFRGGHSAGSSTYLTESATDPLPDGCFQRWVDMAIANAMGPVR